MGGCQNYGPFLGTLNIRGHVKIGTQKGPIILTSPHMSASIMCAVMVVRLLLGGSVPKDSIGLGFRYRNT